MFDSSIKRPSKVILKSSFLKRNRILNQPMWNSQAIQKLFTTGICKPFQIKCQHFYNCILILNIFFQMFKLSFVHILKIFGRMLLYFLCSKTYLLKRGKTH